MFTAKIYDVTEGTEEFIGYVTIDEAVPEITDVSSDYEYIDELEAGINENLQEIVDLHDVLAEDPDEEDSLGVELETPDHRMISIALTEEEDD